MPTPPRPEAPVLFLDAASPRLVVGLDVDAATGPVWRESTEEAGVGLSRETDTLLRHHRLTLDDVRSVVWCDGPGSLLGIRLVAMMLRTWMALPRTQPLRTFAYRSLALVAADRLARGHAPPFHVCSDARRQTWNLLSVPPDGSLGEIRRCSADALPDENAGPLLHPDPFPHWQPLPSHARDVRYDPTCLPTLATTFPLLHETPAPDLPAVDPARATLLIPARIREIRVRTPHNPVSSETV